MFEDLRANIELLEVQRNIAVEDLLDSMCRLFDDAGGADRTVMNIAAYGDKLVNLFDRIRCSYIQEVDKLRGLNDEDINEVMSLSEKADAALKDLQPVLERLIEEEKKYEELRDRLEKATEQQKKLQDEIDKLKDISVEYIEKTNDQLKEECQRRTENAEKLKVDEEELEKIKGEVEILSGRLKECREEKEKAEAERIGKKEAIEEYKQWKKSFEEQKDSISQTAEEAANALTVIKNAWKSVRLRDEFPLSLSSFEEFDQFNSDIKSYSDLEQWFDSTGDGIEKAVEVYIEMYKKTLEVFSKVAK